MINIWNILKKDLLKFRWLLVLWAALIVCRYAALFFLDGGNYKQIFTSIDIFKITAVFFTPALFVLIVHADHAYDSIAFWRTRPLSMWQVLAAKAWLFLTMFLLILAAHFTTMAVLFDLPSSEILRKSLETAFNWFFLLPLCALVTAISRNLLVTFGILLVILLLFFIGGLISGNKMYHYPHLLLIVGVGIPLTGILCQYLTRRTKLVISGGVLAALVTVMVCYQSYSVVQPPPYDYGYMTIENVTVSGSADKIIKGEINIPDGKIIDPLCEVTFEAATGGKVHLYNKRQPDAPEAALLRVLPSGSVCDGKKASLSAKQKFEIKIETDELKNIQGQSGALHVTISGRPYQYEFLTALSPTGSHRITVRDTNIITLKTKPDVADDTDSVVNLMFFGRRDFLRNPLACVLREVDSGITYRLRQYGIDGYYLIVDDTLGTNFIRLCWPNNTPKKYFKPTDYQILIYKKGREQSRRVKSYFTISDFIYTGTD
jgi:hypothetical protein